MKRSLYWYIENLCILTNTDLTKENARINQVLNENGYQGNMSKVFKRITITACVSHNNKRKPQILKRKRSELV